MVFNTEGSPRRKQGCGMFVAVCQCIPKHFPIFVEVQLHRGTRQILHLKQVSSLLSICTAKTTDLIEYIELFLVSYEGQY